ncbi:MAG TPA: hypothetical protein VMF30_00480 [Pirellulales bacterium]|nr:hypothetical protein [Pirellulales bacterium]
MPQAHYTPEADQDLIEIGRFIAAAVALCVSVAGCGVPHDDTHSAFTCNELRNVALVIEAMLVNGHEPEPGDSLLEMLSEASRIGYAESPAEKLLYDHWGHEFAWSVMKAGERGSVISVMSAGIDNVFGNDDDLVIYIAADPDGTTRVTTCCRGYGQPYRQ